MLSALMAVLGSTLLSAAPASVQVKGDYVEARTADVFTGPCFSNAEVFITGDAAVVAWKVSEGTFDGQKLDGLAIAAAVKGTSTFSKDTPNQARSVLIVDEKATPAQRDALIKMAKNLAGERLSNVEEVKVARISLMVESAHPADHASAPSKHHGMPKAPAAQVYVPNLVQILTRPLDEDDHFCGNETVEYSPLSSGVTALPAYTLAHHFKGKALGTTWSDANCRSSFAGHFQF